MTLKSFFLDKKRIFNSYLLLYIWVIRMRKYIFYLMVIINVIALLFTFTYKNEVEVTPSISVEIKGAIKNPGVYKIEENKIVKDIIELSGGLLDNADISTLNMARRLNDEMVVVIYTNDEINEMKEGSTSVKYIDKECVCPIIEKYNCLSDIVSNLDGVINLTGKISLNSGTVEEFITLPGIGEVKAKDIIAYREANKGFKTIEEIMNVKGIGQATFEKIKYYLTL